MIKKDFWKKYFGLEPKKVNNEQLHLMTATWEELLGKEEKERIDKMVESEEDDDVVTGEWIEEDESMLDAEEEKNQMLEDKKRKGQINFGLIRYGGEDGAY